MLVAARTLAGVFAVPVLAGQFAEQPRFPRGWSGLLIVVALPVRGQRTAVGQPVRDCRLGQLPPVVRNHCFEPGA
ncbi:hypothetical protein ABTD06_19900, partial [Acinetobacter baumannii]